MKKDIKKFVAYMLLTKKFKLKTVGKKWYVMYNDVKLTPEDIIFLQLVAKKSGQKFDRLDKTTNPN